MAQLQSYTKIYTKEGSAYIRKLCRHFVHKVPVSYTETAGKAEFPFGICVMGADDESLTFTINANSSEELDRAEDVLVRHLEKFAYKENLDINWTRNELSPA